MNSSLYAIIGLLIGVGAGIIIGRFLLRKLFKAQENSAQNKAKLILKDAENNAEILKKEQITGSKRALSTIKSRARAGIKRLKTTPIISARTALNKKSSQLNSRMENLHP